MFTCTLANCILGCTLGHLLQIKFVFSWDEKLVARLIAAPIVDNALEDKTKAKSMNTGFTCNSIADKRTIPFCNNSDKILYKLQ
jgi:hypothetical protein